MLEFVKVAAPLLAIVSFVLICLSLTKLGEMKVFRFVLGEITFVTAIAYAFQTAFAVNAFAPFSIAIWFAISSMNFAWATWFTTE